MLGFKIFLVLLAAYATCHVPPAEAHREREVAADKLVHLINHQRASDHRHKLRNSRKAEKIAAVWNHSMMENNSIDDYPTASANRHYQFSWNCGAAKLTPKAVLIAFWGDRHQRRLILKRDARRIGVHWSRYKRSKTFQGYPGPCEVLTIVTTG